MVEIANSTTTCTLNYHGIMLGGVVRQPLSPPPAGRSEMMPPSTYGEGPTKAAGSGRGHDHHREGREMIVPLIRRPAPLRLDVAPFLVAYLALAILDLHGRGGADEEPRSGRLDWTAILVDASYALLLLSQLALFFACQVSLGAIPIQPFSF